MTKQDYELVALILLATPDSETRAPEKGAAERHRQTLARAFAREFGKRNERFDAEKFLAAAGASA